MPYTDPNSVSNPTTGNAILTAWGDQVRDDLQAVRGAPRVRVSRSVSQSIPTATNELMVWDTELFDSHAMHGSPNTSRITIPANWGGTYIVGACITWDLNTNGRRYAELWLNGTLKIANAEGHVEQVGGNCSIALSTLWDGAVTDYVEVRVYQTVGGSLNVINSDYATCFWAAFQAGTEVG